MKSQLSEVGQNTREYVAREHKILVNGAWRRPEGPRAEIIDPSTAEVIGGYQSASENDVNDAIASARTAFDNGEWRSLSPAARAKVLWRVADLIDESKQELAEIEALDGGKLFTAALNGEAWAAAEAFRYHAGWCTKIEGRTFRPSIPGLDLEGTTRLEPVGVAGLITPWNGPLVMAAWKLAPALAAGCCVVLKPAENTVLSTLRLGEILCAAGVPDGVVNIVIGGGVIVGNLLAHDARIDKISFTGSTETARSLIDAAKGNLKKLSLELGGKSPAIIFEDADFDSAVEGAAEGIFSNAGQVCVAGSRVLVQRSIYKEFASALCGKARAIKIGRSMSADSQMGPLISEHHRNSVMRFVEQAKSDGLSVLCGGERCIGDGFFFEPTVLEDSDTASTIWREEVFGPVAVHGPI